MHTAMNRAPQGQGEGCRDTPAVECPRLPGSWHLIWATEPKGSSTPGGRQLSGLLICLAPPPWAKGSWERKGAESLALGLGSSCGIHREDGRPAPSGVRLPVGVAMRQSAEDAPEGSRGPAVKSPGFRGNHVWVESLALCPVSLSVLICVMGTMNTLLFYLHGKVSPEQWPVLTSVSNRKG